MGRLIREKQRIGELSTQDRHPGSVPRWNTDIPSTLPEIGVTRKESSTSKNLASTKALGSIIIKILKMKRSKLNFVNNQK